MKLALFSAKISKLFELILITCLGSLSTLAFGVFLRRYFYRLIFRKVGNSTFIQSAVEFHGTRYIHIEDGVYIFRNVRIDVRGTNNSLNLASEVVLEHGASIGAMNNTNVYIGERTFIGPYVLICGPGNITIGNDCLIAGHVGIFANNHKFSNPEMLILKQGVSSIGITIHDNCWLGHNVTVLDGVTIGEGCVIGAGAVVTKNIPPGSVAVGVPARVVSQRYMLASEIK